MIGKGFGLGDVFEKISNTKEFLELKDEFKVILKELGVESMEDLKDKMKEKSAFPAVNTYSTEKENVILLDLPGMEDIDIEIEEDTLTISGKRPEIENLITSESYFGTFSRAFKIPEDSNAKLISSKYKNGVLKIVLPKKTAKKKKVKVKKDV